MPAKRNLFNFAVRQQVLLERLKTHEARQFVASLSAMDDVVTKVIMTLKTEISEASKKELLRVLSVLTEENTRITTKATEKLSERFGALADYQAELETKSIEVVGPSLRIKTLKKGMAYADALARPMSATGELLEPFVSNWSRGEVNRVNNAVRKAWTEGQTNQQLIQAIRGTKKNNYKDGILATTRRNAESVARTGIQHVANSSRMALWEANDDLVVGYIFVATLDGDTTQQCRSLDKKEFKINAGPMPPLHIRCRSTTMAKLDPDLGLDFLDKGATRSSENGYVDGKLSYYDWLKTQPAAFQNEALGPTRAKLFRDGGLSAEKFAELNLGRNFQPLTLEQMRKVAPSAFEKAGLDKP